MPTELQTPRIATTTVELKIIQVGNKQMTLAVFRQLPKKEFIDQTGTLTGSLWGTVKYCSKDCPTEEHKHIVFEQNGKLYQNIFLNHTGVFDLKWFNDLFFIKDCLNAVSSYVGAKIKQSNSTESTSKVTAEKDILTVQHAGRIHNLKFDDVCTNTRHMLFSKNNEDINQYFPEPSNILHTLKQKYPDVNTTNYYDMFVDLVDYKQRRTEDYNRFITALKQNTMPAINQLDQLFIAV